MDLFNSNGSLFTPLHFFSALLIQYQNPTKRTKTMIDKIKSLFLTEKNGRWLGKRFSSSAFASSEVATFSITLDTSNIPFAYSSSLK